MFKNLQVDYRIKCSMKWYIMTFAPACFSKSLIVIICIIHVHTTLSILSWSEVVLLWWSIYIRCTRNEILVLHYYEVPSDKSTLAKVQTAYSIMIKLYFANYHDRYKLTILKRVKLNITLSTFVYMHCVFIV